MSLEKSLVVSLFARESYIPEQYDAVIDSIIPEILMLSRIVLKEYQDSARNKSLLESRISGMLVTSINTLVSAFIMIREGYFKEPQILLRSVVEIVSSAVDLRKNPQKIDSFVNGKHSSTKSITIANSLIPHESPLTGATYGLLSHNIVHLNVLDFFPPHYDTFNEAMFFGSVKNEEEVWRISRSLHMACTILDLMSAYVEYIYRSSLDTLLFWKKNTDGTLIWNLHPTMRERIESRAWLYKVSKEGYEKKFPVASQKPL
ncbi:MAG: hypothetical protein P9X24_08135 [Candidatus Hatepunaea meridiana]|nr:hypothetical protein [Candidatus Hatepunaea meridiana]